MIFPHTGMYTISHTSKSTGAFFRPSPSFAPSPSRRQGMPCCVFGLQFQGMYGIQRDNANMPDGAIGLFVNVVEFAKVFQ